MVQVGHMAPIRSRFPFPRQEGTHRRCRKHRQACLTPRGSGKRDPEGGLPSPPAALRAACDVPASRRAAWPGPDELGRPSYGRHMSDLDHWDGAARRCRWHRERRRTTFQGPEYAALSGRPRMPERRVAKAWRCPGIAGASAPNSRASWVDAVHEHYPDRLLSSPLVARVLAPAGAPPCGQRIVDSGCGRL